MATLAVAMFFIGGSFTSHSSYYEGELVGVSMLAIPLAEFHVFVIMDVSKWICIFVCKRNVLNQL